MSEAFLSEMKAHARETYPDECCGFLIGSPPETDGERRRTISALERARNEFDGERRRRFLILPAELREVERRTEQSGRAVVGFYHSHPDHPAQPSQYDQDHAWPWYSVPRPGGYRHERSEGGRFRAGPGHFHLPRDSPCRRPGLRTAPVGNKRVTESLRTSRERTNHAEDDRQSSHSAAPVRGRGGGARAGGLHGWRSDPHAGGREPRAEAPPVHARGATPGTS